MRMWRLLLSCSSSLLAPQGPPGGFDNITVGLSTLRSAVCPQRPWVFPQLRDYSFPFRASPLPGWRRRLERKTQFGRKGTSLHSTDPAQHSSRQPQGP